MCPTTFKVIIIGESCTGKTSYVRKLQNGSFDDNYKATIEPKFNLIKLEIDKELYGIQLWEISAQEENLYKIKVCARDSFGCIVMTDATNDKTRKK